MSELSPRGQTLLHASRAALRPDTSDRERVLAGLRERLGGAPLAGTGKVQAAAQVSRSLWAVSAVALLGVGSAVAVGLSAAPSHVPAARAPALISATPRAVASLSAPLPAALPVPIRAPASAIAAAPSTPSKRVDRLAEEVSILSQAAKDLRAGRAAEALSALNEHQKKFPGGLLTQERRAARAEALCSLGRFSEAQTELSILGRSAESPLLVRARERCKARSAKSP